MTVRISRGIDGEDDVDCSYWLDPVYDSESALLNGGNYEAGLGYAKSNRNPSKLLEHREIGSENNLQRM